MLVIEDQRDMAKRMSKLSDETCYHGHAGMASGFAALAHKKLKPGGVAGSSDASITG